MYAHSARGFGHFSAAPSNLRKRPRGRLRSVFAAILIGLALPAMAWEPTAPVELVVPAGTGGGADLMARFIQQVVFEKKMNLGCYK